MNQKNLLTSAVENATGLSGPALFVLVVTAVIIVWGIAHWYRSRGGR